jgi:hypothetical protein
MAFLLDVGPLRSALMLVAFHSLSELLVPNVRCGYVDGVGCELQGKFFGIAALAGAFSASDEYDSFHSAKVANKSENAFRKHKYILKLLWFHKFFVYLWQYSINSIHCGLVLSRML